MAVPYLTQLQPFEENQSPSPVEEIPNPYELTLTRSKSPGRTSSKAPSSPVNTTNNLHRQLSSDPDNPPPAWQRRPSVSTQRSGRSPSVHSNGHTETRSHRSPSNSSHQSPTSGLPPARRRLNLTMTSSRPGMPSQVFLHESPTGSSTSLNDDPTLTLPQPAFRRRAGGGGGSNRSSIASSQDLSSLTSEELWSYDHQDAIADLSNPTRESQERPLTTVRRMSSKIDHKPYQSGLPGEVIWPAAPPPEEMYNPPIKSRSVTSMASLRGNKRMSKSKRNSRQASLDIPNGAMKGKTLQYPKSTPVSPSVNVPQDSVLISSTNSSSTSLASHQMPNNKSSVTLGSRPPSAYYSRDFLSSLAPREGGYAIAAQMGNGLGAAGTMSVEEKRRSTVYDDSGRSRNMSRAPMSKSSGMGRWSLDGGEHYGRPYASSNNTTSTSLSTRGNATPDGSPPADESGSRNSYLPDGASPPVANTGARNPVLDIPAAHAHQSVSSPSQAVSSVPITPSPLSRATTTAEQQSPKVDAMPTNPLNEAAFQASGSHPIPRPAPISLSEPTTATLSPKKSKKDLAKEAKSAQKAAKAAEKAEAEKVARQRVAAAREALLKKQAEKDAAKNKAKEDKRKEKAEKEKRKAEKRKSKLKSSSAINLPFFKSGSNTPSTNASATASGSVPPVPPVPAALKTAPMVDRSQNQGDKPKTEVPFPGMPNSHPAQNSVVTDIPPRRTRSSMPIGGIAGTSSTPVQRQVEPKPSRSRLGMLGTIRKRLSVFGSDIHAPQDSSVASAPLPATSRASVPTADEQPSQAHATPTVPSQQQSVSITPDVERSGSALENSQLSRIVTPPQVTGAPVLPTPVQLDDLPPRSTSRMSSVITSPSFPSAFTSPQSFQTASGTTPPRLERSSSQQSPQMANSSPLTKTVSQDRGANGSPSNSIRRTSLLGPRPMPAARSSPEPRSRPVSISTTASEHPHSFLNQSSPRLGGPDLITPSTSGDDSATSMYSHTISTDRATNDLSSPFTSDSGDGDASRKNSIVIDGLDLDKHRKGVDSPEREGSNETIHPAINAPPVVSAH